MEECQRNREASEMDERILMSVFCETFSLKQLLTSIDYKMGGGVSCVLKKSRAEGREDYILHLYITRWKGGIQGVKRKVERKEWKEEKKEGKEEKK